MNYYYYYFDENYLLQHDKLVWHFVAHTILIFQQPYCLVVHLFYDCIVFIFEDLPTNRLI